MAKLIVNIPVDVSSQKITNVAEPTENLDAANKQYVDSQISSAGGQYIAQNNGNGTGTTTLENLTVSGNITTDNINVTTSITVPTPSGNNNAANKSYVDTTISNEISDKVANKFLPLAGGTMQPNAMIVFGQNASASTNYGIWFENNNLCIGERNIAQP